MYVRITGFIYVGSPPGPGVIDFPGGDFLPPVISTNVGKMSFPICFMVLISFVISVYIKAIEIYVLCIVSIMSENMLKTSSLYIKARYCKFCLY